MTVRPTRALLARCSALLVLLAGLAGPLHHLLVRHAVCAEHGEVLHVADGPATEAPERVERFHHGDGPALAAGTEAGRDAHCVCELALTQRESPASVAGPALVLPSAPAPVVALRAQTPFPRSFAQFLLAPKHSPPAA